MFVIYNKMEINLCSFLSIFFQIMSTWSEYSDTVNIGWVDQCMSTLTKQFRHCWHTRFTRLTVTYISLKMHMIEQTRLVEDKYAIYWVSAKTPFATGGTWPSTPRNDQPRMVCLDIAHGRKEPRFVGLSPLHHIFCIQDDKMEHKANECSFKPRTPLSP